MLSGLRVEWGRPTTIDQPQPATATFKVLDPTTGARLAPTLTIGRRVDVRSDATIYPAPSTSTIPAIVNGGVTGGSVTIAGGGQSASLLSETGPPTTAITFTMPPLAYSASPVAWDGVPRTVAGQDWRYQLTVAFPAAFLSWHNYAATVQAVAFTDPDGSKSSLVGSPVAVPASGAVDVTFTPPPGVWLGLQLRVWPVGPAWDQLDATSWNGITAPGPSWNALETFSVSGLKMLAPAGGAGKAALVFSGRVTDVESAWDGAEAVEVTVIAQDWTAELANRYVGDQPWLLESLGVRAQRIVTLSQQPIALTVDATPAALQVTWRDVDSQPATDLLQQLARSAGGVLWCATHMVTGPLLWLEDVTRRPAALTLALGTDGLVHVVPSAAALANALPLSACDIDASPVRFNLDTSDVASQVAVGWVEQGTPPTMVARTETLTDVVLSQTIGLHRISVTTQLALQPDAAALASVLMARFSAMGWRLSGIQWDTADDDALMSPDEITRAFRLLDGTTRIGLPMTLTDLPDWTDSLISASGQVAVYVEGGNYEYLAGNWLLALRLSAAKGSATGSFPWTASPAAWTWDTYGQEVSWLDLFGVTYP